MERFCVKNYCFDRTIRDLVRSSSSGFTLVEVTVILMIITVITGATLTMGKETLDAAYATQTTKKMDIINEALASFIVQNNRLPCPADATLATTNANYGKEADVMGDCLTGTPAAISASADVVTGAVPYKTLGLTENMTYDGWERKFVYAVTRRMTEYEAFTAYEIFDQYPGITVNEASGNSRTVNGIYALASLGKDKGNGYQKDGAKLTVAGAETENGDDDDVFIQKAHDLSGSPVYDDFVEFYERWHFQNAEDDRKLMLYSGPEFMVTEGCAVRFISFDGTTYTEMASPTLPEPIPGMNGCGLRATAVSVDNRFWAVGGYFRYGEDYPGDGDDYVEQYAYIIIFERDETTGEMSVAETLYGNAPDIYELKFSNTTANLLAVGYSPFATVATPGSVWKPASNSPDPASMLANVYERDSGGSWSSIFTALSRGLYTSEHEVHTISISKNDRLFFFGSDNHVPKYTGGLGDPNDEPILLFERTVEPDGSSVFTLQGDASAFVDASAAYREQMVQGSAISPDGRYLVIHQGTGYTGGGIYAIDRNPIDYGDKLFAIAGEDCGFGESASGICDYFFDSRSRYLFSHDAIYRVNPVNDSFTEIDTLDSAWSANYSFRHYLYRLEGSEVSYEIQRQKFVPVSEYLATAETLTISGGSASLAVAQPDIAIRHKNYKPPFRN